MAFKIISFSFSEIACQMQVCLKLSYSFKSRELPVQGVACALIQQWRWKLVGLGVTQRVPQGREVMMMSNEKWIRRSSESILHGLNGTTVCDARTTVCDARRLSTDHGCGCQSDIGRRQFAAERSLWSLDKVIFPAFYNRGLHNEPNGNLGELHYLFGCLG